MEEQGKKNPVEPTDSTKCVPAARSRSGSTLIWIALLAILVAIAATVFLVKYLGNGRKSARTKVQETTQQAHRVKKAISKMLRVEKPDWASPSTGMEFVWVPALNMWVGKYEVTNDEYQKKDPAHDSRDYKGYRLTGARQPVVYVNFEDACAYAEWLTAADKATGKLPKDHKYRLPSEDEWKIFAKGDDDRMYPWGGEWPPVSGQAGNYDDETVFDSISVDGGYQDGAPVTCDVEKSWKNPAGLYGVGGNVWEPTSSNSGDNVFAAWHGGSWLVSSPVALQCNHGVAGGGSDRTKDYGFRLVLAGPEED